MEWMLTMLCAMRGSHSYLLNYRESESAEFVSSVNARKLSSVSEARLRKYSQMGWEYYFDAASANWSAPFSFQGVRHNIWSDDIERIPAYWTSRSITSALNQDDTQRDAENENQIAQALQTSTCEIFKYRTSGQRIKERIKRAFKGMDNWEKRTLEYSERFKGFYVYSSRLDFGKKAIVKFRYVMILKRNEYWVTEVGYQLREGEF